MIAPCGCTVGGLHTYGCGLVGHVDPPARATPAPDERLAKVAEVLAGHRVNYHHKNVGGDTASTMRFTSCEGCDWLGGHRDEMGWEQHVAQALAPLLEEFRAEDEARALREAAEAWRDEGRGVMFNRDRLDLSPEGRVGKWLRDRVGDGHTCCACFTNNGLPCCNAGHRAALAAAEPDAGAR